MLLSESADYLLWAALLHRNSNPFGSANVLCSSRIERTCTGQSSKTVRDAIPPLLLCSCNTLCRRRVPWQTRRQRQSDSHETRPLPLQSQVPAPHAFTLQPSKQRKIAMLRILSSPSRRCISHSFIEPATSSTLPSARRVALISAPTTPRTR